MPRISSSNTYRTEGNRYSSKFCFNCLGSGHVLAKCISQSKCKTCHSKHHFFLDESSTKPDNSSVEIHSTLAIELDHEKSDKISLLPAQVEVLDKRGNKVKHRALLDTCAHISTITTAACKKLGLQVEHFNERNIEVNQASSQLVEGNVKVSVRPKH